MVVPDNVENREDQMEGIKEVESSQKIVEADLLFFQQNKNRQGISYNAKGSKHEHENPWLKIMINQKSVFNFKWKMLPMKSEYC